MKIFYTFLVFLAVYSCQMKKTGVVEFKKAETSEGMKQLLSIYIDDSKLNPDEFIVYISQDRLNELEINAYLRKEFIGDKSDLQYYVENVHGFRVFFAMDIDKRFFDFQDKTLTEDISLSKLSNDGSDDVPLTYDTPYWILSFEENKIINFKFEFCDPHNLLIENIKSIDF